MTVLITGGTGFLGSELARQLLERDRGPVVLFDLFPNAANVADIAGDVTTVRGDFAEPTEVAHVLHAHGVTDVFHLGYLTGEAEQFPGRAIRTNCGGTNAVFECAMAAGVRRVLWPSSAAVYGATVTSASPRWLTEDDPPAPDSLYGACKLFNEHVAERHVARAGFDHLALRLSSIVGPGRGDRRGIAPDLYAQLLERSSRGEPVEVPPLDHVLSWGYVKDVARAFVTLLDLERPARRIYNFAGPSVEVGEVVDLVRDACPDARIEVVPDAPRHLAYVDASRLSDDVGFAPAWPVARAVADHLTAIAV